MRESVVRRNLIHNSNGLSRPDPFGDHSLCFVILKIPFGRGFFTVIRGYEDETAPRIAATRSGGLISFKR